MPLPENPKELKPTDPYEVIRVTIGYLTNNEARMDYPRYRRAGLPTCSGLVESLVKQFNRRVEEAPRNSGTRAKPRRFSNCARHSSATTSG